MAAFTNWKSAGSAANQSSLQSIQLAQADERMRQQREDAAWSRKRKQAQDAENARRFNAQQRNADRAFEAQREEAAWNRKRQQAQDAESARRFEAQQRNADRAFDAQREDAAWNRAYQQRAQDFQQMLAQDELERKREMRRREDAQYEQLMKQQADARAQQEASFASLLRYGVQAGERDDKGTILIPPAYIDQFNKTNGSQLGGIAILTRNDRGEALDYPQVMLMKRNAQGQIIPDGVMSNAQVRMMFEAFPDVSEEMAKKAGLTGGSGNSAWLRALGVKTPTARNEASSDSAFRRDAGEYYKSALEMIGKRKAALMRNDAVTNTNVPPNKETDPQAYEEFQRLLQDERYYQEAWGRLIGIDARSRDGDGAPVKEAGGAPKQENKPKWRPKHNLGNLGMHGAI